MKVLHLHGGVEAQHKYRGSQARHQGARGHCPQKSTACMRARGETINQALSLWRDCSPPCSKHVIGESVSRSSPLTKPVLLVHASSLNHFTIPVRLE